MVSRAFLLAAFVVAAVLFDMASADHSENTPVAVKKVRRRKIVVPPQSPLGAAGVAPFPLRGEAGAGERSGKHIVVRRRKQPHSHRQQQQQQQPRQQMEGNAITISFLSSPLASDLEKTDAAAAAAAAAATHVPYLFFFVNPRPSASFPPSRRDCRRDPRQRRVCRPQQGGADSHQAQSHEAQEEEDLSSEQDAASSDGGGFGPGPVGGALQKLATSPAAAPGIWISAAGDH